MGPNTFEDDIDILTHYGMPFRSGRYPYGSGKNPYQRAGDFISRVDKLRKLNFTFTDDDGKTWTGDTAIAKSLDLTSTQFRTQLSLANNERRAEKVKQAQELRDKGHSLMQIAKKMGYKNDSSVRSLLNSDSKIRMNEAENIASFLKKQVDKHGMIDVGVGVERQLGISKEKLKQALYILEMEGYKTYGGGIPQVTNPGRQTNVTVLGVPGTEHKDIYDFEKVHSVRDFKSNDGGKTFDPVWVYPKSMDSKRLAIRYDEEGGSEKDGVVELRRGVDDISLGGSNYSQVRILVDGNKYIKGMAVYSDDMPDGVDVIFNTNKKKGTPMGDVLKDISSDPTNPFGSLIKSGIHDPKNPNSDEKVGQSYYYDKDGKKQLSLINKRADEGDWNEWANKLPSQFLAKQNKKLLEKQLGLTIADKRAEYDDILILNNPTVKKNLLQSFADDCDAAAEHLKAAALPRQKYQVILPVTSMKDDEVYAPNYKNGEKVALVRFPHGGTFEIPVLTVNNKHKDSIKMLGNTPADVVCINSKVAERLSGADFDGDTVMVIPTNPKVKITSTPALKGLEGFDPREAYGGRKEGTFRPMKNTQTEMGVISNLITDMTLKGATDDELAKAVRHSMVVIDAEKHGLDYKQSELDNDISYLKKRYQGSIDKETGKYSEGASTIISRAKSQVSVPKRKGSPIIDPKTGKVSYKETGEEYTVYKDGTDPKTGEPIKIDTGKTRIRTQQSTAMLETDDAYTLVSEARAPQEIMYADYANTMKAMANDARKELLSTGKIKYSPSAKKVYQEEVNSLDNQLNIALMNAPREREAQRIANSVVTAKKQANPDMTKGEIKKANQLAITDARNKVGAKRTPVTISDKEWEAIQSGAISENKLTQILNHTDLDEIRKRATPRTMNTLSPAKINKIESMKASGYSTSEIAESIGVSTSTINKHLSGKE